MCELNSDMIPTCRSSLRHLYFYSNHGPQKHAQKAMLQLVVFVVSLKLDNPALATSLWLALLDIVFVIYSCFLESVIVARGQGKQILFLMKKQKTWGHEEYFERTFLLSIIN